MYDDIDDSVGDLIASEQLQGFSVLDKHCQTCSRVTPHHIDESQAAALDINLEDNSEDLEAIVPLSILECVVCREIEENKLDF